MPQVTLDVGERLAGRQRQANAAVAREITGAGQDQIAHAGQTHEGFGPGAERDTEAGNFDQTTRHQGSTGIQAQPEAIADAGGNGHDVLHRTADFGTDDIVVGIQAQARAMQGLGHRLGKSGIGGSERNGRRQTTRHLVGETRASECAAARSCMHVSHDLMRQQAGAGFQSLADPEEGQVGTRLCQLLCGGAQSGHRRGDERKIGVGNGGREVGRERERFRERVAGQEVTIFVRALHGGGMFGLPGPQRDFMALGK